MKLNVVSVGQPSAFIYIKIMKAKNTKQWLEKKVCILKWLGHRPKCEKLMNLHLRRQRKYLMAEKDNSYYRKTVEYF